MAFIRPDDFWPAISPGGRLTSHKPYPQLMVANQQYLRSQNVETVFQKSKKFEKPRNKALRADEKNGKQLWVPTFWGVKLLAQLSIVQP